MRYQYLPYDPRRYSFNLQLSEEENLLLWECAPRQSVLLVETPYGVNAEAFMERFCAGSGGAEFRRDAEYFLVEPRIYFRYVAASERARNRGCPIHGRGCTYTVFSCQVTGEGGEAVCQVYAPPARQRMNPVSCAVPRKVEVTVSRAAAPGGFLQRLFRGGDDEGMYRISFSNRDDPCEDGDLKYQVRKYTYPILKEMYLAGGFYVRSPDRPVILSCNPSLDVATTNR